MIYVHTTVEQKEGQTDKESEIIIYMTIYCLLLYLPDIVLDFLSQRGSKTGHFYSSELISEAKFHLKFMKKKSLF